MAKRSPPTPFETGSIKPRVAFAAIAASTAEPPRFKMSSPTCVASGTLVQTIPWRASTSERVAKCRPVMRSTWAKSDDAAKEDSTMTTADRFFIALFVAQRLDRIEPRGAICRQERKNAADQKRAETNNGDIARNDFSWQFRKLVNLFRKHFDAERAGEPLAEFVPIPHRSE